MHIYMPRSAANWSISLASADFGWAHSFISSQLAGQLRTHCSGMPCLSFCDWPSLGRLAQACSHGEIVEVQDLLRTSLGTIAISLVPHSGGQSKSPDSQT